MQAVAGNGGSSIKPPTAPSGTTVQNHFFSPVEVSVSAPSLSVSSGGTLQFTAVVRNTSNTAVNWSTSLGSISAQGLLQAPKVTSSQNITVVATSIASPGSNATAGVMVLAAQSLKISTDTLTSGVTGSSYNATLSASGGTSPYTWVIATGTLPTGIKLKQAAGSLSGTPSQSGTYNFTVSVTDSANHQATQALALNIADDTASGSFDGPAELPRVYLQTSVADTPAPGKTTTVNAGGDFQSALDNAACGDTITLQAGAVFPGLFTVPQKSCDDQHWIIIRTSAPDTSLPAEGTRITPCYAGVAQLPGRPSFNCTSTKNVMAQLIYTGKAGSGPIMFASGANHYRFIGLEVTRLAGKAFISDLIGPSQDSPADHIVLDRMWVHGTAHDETTRGVYLAGITSAAVVDSYFTDFHCVSMTGSCTDAQAVGGGGRNFPAGPYRIFDNFLEASGENILFGGGEATTSPADIEIRQNHLFKPLIWMPGHPGFVGGTNGRPFVVKNNFELKNAERVLFEGNILEYTWGGFSQFGYSIVLTPKNQAVGISTNSCPACRVTDVTIRYSTVSHAAAGINIANAVSDNGGIAAAGGRYSIHDVTLDDIDSNAYAGAGPLVLVMNGWPRNILGGISINHITGFGDASHPALSVGNDTSNPKMSNFIYTNNLVLAGEYPIWTSGGKTNCAYSTIPLTVISTCFQPYTFVKNAFIDTPAYYSPSKWPADNFFPPDPAYVQFVNYNNAKGGDYHLQPSSPYKNAGTDGKDLGADIDAIQAQIAQAY